MPRSWHDRRVCDGAADLVERTDRLIARLRAWTPARYAARAAGGRRRGDALHELVQRLADLAADAEGQPRRPVPRLASDLVLPDQLRVVVHDLLRAGPVPELVRQAADALAALEDRR